MHQISYISTVYFIFNQSYFHYLHTEAQLRLCVCMYVCLFICLSMFVSGNNKSVSWNCAQSMQAQAMGSNPLSGSIICLSVRPSVRFSSGLLRFWYLYLIVLILCRWLQLLLLIPVWGSNIVMNLYLQWGPKDPIGVQLKLCVCVSVPMSLCLSVLVFTSLFGDHFCGS